MDVSDGLLAVSAVGLDDVLVGLVYMEHVTVCGCRAVCTCCGLGPLIDAKGGEQSFRRSAEG